MKPRYYTRQLPVSILIAGFAVSQLIGTAFAATSQYWNVAGTGGSGNWSTAPADANWNTSVGAVGNYTWPNTINDVATFADAIGGTVTVSGGVQTAGIVQNGAANYTIQGSIITLVQDGAANNPFVNAQSGTLTISSTLAGSNGLIKNGAGTLILSGTNTYTGTTNVTNGTLSLGASNVLADASTLTLAGGTTLAMGANSDTVASLTSAGTISGTGTLTATTYNLNAGTSLTGKLGTGTINSNGAVGITGTAGALAVNVQTGTMTLSGNNLADTATVAITNVGTLALNGNDTIGTLNSNGTISGAGVLTATTYNLNAGTSVTGKLGLGTLNSNGAVGITGTADALSVNVQSGTMTLSGNNLADGSTVTLSGVATLALNGPDIIGTLNSNGTISGAGVLTATTYNLNAGTSVTGNLGLGTLNSNGAVGITGAAGALTVNVLTGTMTLNGNNLADTSTVALSSGATLALNGSDTIGTLNSNGTISGAGTLTAATYNLITGTSVSGNLGLGTLNSNGTVGITGTAAALTVNVQSGTMTLGGNNLADASTVTITNIATLALNGPDTVGSLVSNGGTISGAGTLTATTYALNTGTSVTGNLGLGTINSNGAVDMSGGTATALVVNVQTGTLKVGSTSLAGGAAVNLGVAATSSGILNYTGAAGTVASNINALGNGLDTIQNSGTGLLTLSGTIAKNGTVLTLKGGANGINVTGSITGASAGSDLIVDGGITTLSNANTYNGPTYIIDGATLNANAANALPTANGRTAVIMDQTGTGTSSLTLGTNQSIASLTGAATSQVNLNASTLTIGTTSGSTTFAGAITGAGGLTKDGASTLRLSGNNNYAGATAVNSGILEVAANNALGSAAGATTVANGATLKLVGVNYTTAEALVINGTGVGGTGALLNSGTSTYAGQVTAATNATINTGGGALTFTGGWVKNGTTLTLTGGGTVTVNTVGISGALANSDLIVDSTTVNENVANTYNGATYLRSGGVLNANVLNALPTSIARSAVIMDDIGSGSSILNLGASQSIASLTGAVSSSVNINSGTLTIGTTTGTSTFAGTINGAGSLAKDGPSTEILSNANSYAGGTALIGGTLLVGNNTALGTGTLTITGGTIGSTVNPITLNNAVVVNGDFSTTRAGSANALIFSGGVDLGGGNRTITNLNGGNTAFSGVISNGTGLTLASPLGTPSTFQFTSGGVVNNTYSGTTTLNGPTLLLLTRGAGSNSIPGDLVLNDSSQVFAQISEQIIDTSNVTLNGTSNLTLQAASTAETIATLNGTSTTTSVTLNGAALTLNSANNGSYAGSINGTAASSLTKTGNGTQTLSGTNSYDGATNINGGVLIAGSNTALGSTVGGTTVAAGGTLQLAAGVNLGTEALTLTGVGYNPGAGALGALAMTAGGTGTVGGLITLGGAAGTNTVITSNAGSVLNLNGGINKTDRTLTGTGGGVVNVNGAITGNAVGFNDDLIINGAMWNLNAANTYLGPTTITSTVAGNGIVNANAANALPTASGRTTITMDNSGAGSSQLNLTGGFNQSIASLAGASTSLVNLNGNTLTIGTTAGSTTFAGVISGAGGKLTKDGASSQTLSGTNTFTGGTLVSAGTLVLANASNNTLADSSTVSVANPGTLSLTTNDTITTLNSNGTIAGAGTLTATTYNLNTGTSVTGHLGLGTLFSNGAVALSGTASAGFVNIQTGTFTNTGTLGTALTHLDIAGGATLVANGTQNYALLTTSGAGAGTWQGNLTNTTTVAPGGVGTYQGPLTTVGTLNVTGNFTNNTGATLSMDVGTGGHDLLVVGGTANLGGILDINKVGAAEIPQFVPVNIIAAGSYTGNFTSITENLDGAVFFNPATGDIRRISITGGKDDPTLFGATLNQTSAWVSLYDDVVAPGVTNITYVPGGVPNYNITGGIADLSNPDLLWALNSSFTATGLNAALLNRLSPEVYVSMSDYAIQATRAHQRTAFAAPTIATNAPAPASAGSKNAAPAPAVGASQWEVFAAADYFNVGTSNSANNADYGLTSMSAMVGARAKLTDRIRLAAYVAGDDGTISGNLIDATGNGWSLGLLGEAVLNEAKGTRLTGGVSYGSYSFDGTRGSASATNLGWSPGLVGFSGVSTDALEISLGIESVAYHTSDNNFRLIPTAGLHYATGSVDGFRETTGAAAGSPIALVVNRINNQSMLGEVSLIAEADLTSKLTVRGQAGYSTDFMDNPHTITARFAKGVRPMTMTATGLPAEALFFGVGATYKFTDTISAGISYRAEFRSGADPLNSVNLGTTFGF